jgi:hypothetical protein
MDLVIDETNFNQYFFDIKEKPQKGQVLARYTGMADLLESKEKDFIVDALMGTKMGADMAAQVMKKHFHATDHDSIRVPQMILEDLNELSPNEVKKKPYRFQLEYFYWTNPENIPTDDPHWETITLGKNEKSS